MMLNRKRIWEILEPSRPGDVTSRIFDFVFSIIIGLAVLSVILGSVPSIYSKYQTILWGFEVFCLAIFSAEYLLRLWSCREDARYCAPWGRLRFIFSFMSIIDLLAILP